MDIPRLPHAIMITTADVTDRNSAIEMVDYYCNITDNLSLIKKFLLMETIQDKILMMK